MMHLSIPILLVLVCAIQINESSIFACDFEDGTMCGMYNGVSPVNFTVVTGETVTDKALGPAVDHTLNKPSGHFLYWYRSTQNLGVRVDGIVNIPAFILLPNLCLNFAYYIKSMSTPDKLSALGVVLIGCSQGLVWSKKVIESQGWQVVQANLPNDQCSAMLSLFVSSNSTGGVSISVDDIFIDTCKSHTIRRV